MHYRTLGRTGMQISALVLGAMNFGAIGRTTQDGATALVDAALEAGINRVRLDAVDAIDEIVAPGVDLAPDEKVDAPPALLDPALRRR